MKEERKLANAVTEEQRAYELFVKAFRNSVRAWNRYNRSKKRAERYEIRLQKAMELEEKFFAEREKKES